MKAGIVGVYLKRPGFQANKGLRVLEKKLNPHRLGILILALLLIFCNLSDSFGDTYEQTYLANSKFGYEGFELHVSVPISLFEYYCGRPHTARRDSDYANFVTPTAFEMMAQNLREVTQNEMHEEEEFANAVLSMIHKLTYKETRIKYPIETIVENSGDCDTLSLLAASIMKAGGLDVVLFYYKQLTHINLGIYLPDEPYRRSAWTMPTFIKFNGKKYWVAECTPGNDWKVGEQPSSIYEKPVVISLEESEEQAPAQVSFRIGSPLKPSAMSINLMPEPANSESGERTIKISGSVTPAYPEGLVTIYVSRDGKTFDAFRTVADNAGMYAFSWKTTSTGTYYVRASWSGSSEYAATDSEILTIFIGFPKTILQFEAPTYSYILGKVSVASYEFRIRKGVEEFLSAELSGDGVSLSGEFMVLESGQTITITKEGEIIWEGEKPTPETPQQIMVSSEDQPLRLPSTFAVNDQFSLILRNKGEKSYSLDVRGLDQDEIDGIKQLDDEETAFIDLSSLVKEDTWYRIVANMTELEIAAQVKNQDGTTLEDKRADTLGTSISELGILLANNTNRVVVFKSLKFEPLNQSSQEKDVSQTGKIELLYQFANWIIIAVSVLALTIFLRKRKQIIYN